MKLPKLERTLIEVIKEAINSNKSVKGNISAKYRRSIGTGLGYYITYLLEKLPEPDINGKWLDGVDWKELRLVSPNKLTGYGFIWWGFTDDNTAETFPDKFYCNLEFNVSKKAGLSYLFEFQIDRKKYELKN